MSDRAKVQPLGLGFGKSQEGTPGSPEGTGDLLFIAREGLSI